MKLGGHLAEGMAESPETFILYQVMSSLIYVMHFTYVS